MRRTGFEGFPVPCQAKVESLRISTEPIPGGLDMRGGTGCVTIGRIKMNPETTEKALVRGPPSDAGSGDGPTSCSTDRALTSTRRLEASDGVVHVLLFALPEREER